jgi:hypothetical protein
VISRGLIVALALVFVTAYVAEAEFVTDGLIAYWPFDRAYVDGETAEDVSGENNGTVFGNPPIVEGKVNQALEFDGSDDYFETKPSDALSLEDATLELWMRQGAAAPWELIIKVANMQGQGDGIEISIENGLIEIWTSGGRANATASISDGNWHHVVAVVSGTDLILYVDGENKGTGVGSLGMAGLEATMTVGRDPGHDTYFAGAIDEVRVYDRALSEEEVEQNMQAKGMVAVKPAGKLAETWGKIKISR